MPIRTSISISKIVSIYFGVGFVYVNRPSFLRAVYVNVYDFWELYFES